VNPISGWRELEYKSNQSKAYDRSQMKKKKSKAKHQYIMVAAGPFKKGEQSINTMAEAAAKMTMDLLKKKFGL
jgi:hypothetical protein